MQKQIITENIVGDILQDPSFTGDADNRITSWSRPGNKPLTIGILDYDYLVNKPRWDSLSTLRLSI